MTHLPPDGGMVQRFAQYACTARSLPLDAEAEQAALRCMLDLLAATMAGLQDPGVVAVWGVASRLMGRGEYPIWFAGLGGASIAVT